jgi:hypothetical protein
LKSRSGRDASGFDFLTVVVERVEPRLLARIGAARGRRRNAIVLGLAGALVACVVVPVMVTDVDPAERHAVSTASTHLTVECYSPLDGLEAEVRLSAASNSALLAIANRDPRVICETATGLPPSSGAGPERDGQDTKSDSPGRWIACGGDPTVAKVFNARSAETMSTCASRQLPAWAPQR